MLRTAFLALTLAACAGTPAPKPPTPVAAPIQASRNPADWSTYADASTTAHIALLTLPNGDLGWSFPTLPASADYLFTGVGIPSLAQAHSLSASYTVTASADAVIDFAHGAGNVCPGVPTVRLLIEATGPLMDSAGDTLPFTRWYSPPVTLAAGQTTISASLTDVWTDVFGEHSDSQTVPVAAAGSTEAQPTTTPAQGFADALSRAQVGLVYGGGCFAGHGVGLTAGSAVFDLDSFVVN